MHAWLVVPFDWFVVHMFGAKLIYNFVVDVMDKKKNPRLHKFKKLIWVNMRISKISKHNLYNHLPSLLNKTLEQCSHFPSSQLLNTDHLSHPLPLLISLTSSFPWALAVTDEFTRAISHEHLINLWHELQSAAGFALKSAVLLNRNIIVSVLLFWNLSLCLIRVKIYT